MSGQITVDKRYLERVKFYLAISGEIHPVHTCQGLFLTTRYGKLVPLPLLLVPASSFRIPVVMGVYLTKVFQEIIRYLDALEETFSRNMAVRLCSAYRGRHVYFMRWLVYDKLSTYSEQTRRHKCLRS